MIVKISLTSTILETLKKTIWKCEHNNNKSKNISVTSRHSMETLSEEKSRTPEQEEEISSG